MMLRKMMNCIKNGCLYDKANTFTTSCVHNLCFFLYPLRPDQLVFSYQVKIKADSFPQLVYEQHCLEKEQVALEKRHQLPKSRLRKIGDG